MEQSIYFAVTFLVVFLLFLLNYLVKKNKGTLNESRELELLCIWFKIKRKDLNIKKTLIILLIINSFIISFTSLVFTTISLSYIWKILISFSLVTTLLFISYGIVGTFIIKKKENKNGKHKRNRK